MVLVCMFFKRIVTLVLARFRDSFCTPTFFSIGIPIPVKIYGVPSGVAVDP